MAFRVIDDSLASNHLISFKKKNLKNIKNNILCEGNPPLEPVFGDKNL